MHNVCNSNKLQRSQNTQCIAKYTMYRKIHNVLQNTQCIAKYTMYLKIHNVSQNAQCMQFE